MRKELLYSVLDVFAERGMEGNPLAVFHDAQGLTTEQMQAIALEMNLSETTFLLPEDEETEAREGVRVRIFTTQEELPFAGHPTLGTASWLYLNQARWKGAHEITLKENVGPIPVSFAGSRGNGVYGTMRQNDPVFGEEHDPAEVSAIIGMTLDDLLPGYMPQTVSTANPFCIVALRSVETLGRLAIPQREATVWLREHGVRWFYCIAPGGDGSWRARMQWYGGEDPATGSAAGPCIAWLVKTGLAASETDVLIRQGVEMLRPSQITVRAKLMGERVVDVRVSGRTIPVAEGRLFLP